MKPEGFRGRWSGGEAGQAFALSFWFLFLLAANLLTPLWGDDWCRVGVAAGPVAVLQETWKSYFEWTGRIGPMFWTFLMLGPGHGTPLPWFEAVNALVFVALVWTLVRLGEVACGVPPTARTRGFAGSYAIHALTGLLLWWVPASIAESALWKTGAIGYLWAVAAAAFLVERALAISRGDDVRRLGMAGLAIFAAMAGTFLETVSLVTVAMLGLLALRTGVARPPGRKILVLAVAYGIGVLLLFVAPGNLKRLTDFAPMSLAEWGAAWFWFLRSVFDPILVAVGAVLAGAWLGLRSEQSRPPWRAILPFAAAVAAYFATLLPLPAGALYARLGFPASVALCGAALVIALSIPLNPKRERVLALVLGLAVIPSVTGYALRDILRIGDIQRDWPALSAAHAAGGPRNGALDLPFDADPRGRVWVTDKHRFYAVVTDNPDHWANRCLARSLGVTQVRGVLPPRRPGAV